MKLRANFLPLFMSPTLSFTWCLSVWALASLAPEQTNRRCDRQIDSNLWLLIMLKNLFIIFVKPLKFEFYDDPKNTFLHFHKGFIGKWCMKKFSAHLKSALAANPKHQSGNLTTYQETYVLSTFTLGLVFWKTCFFFSVPFLVK